MVEAGPAEDDARSCWPSIDGLAALEAAGMLDDMTGKLLDRYRDDTVVLSGHDAPTTLDEERPQLAEWCVRG